MRAENDGDAHPKQLFLSLYIGNTAGRMEVETCSLGSGLGGAS